MTTTSGDLADPFLASRFLTVWRGRLGPLMAFALAPSILLLPVIAAVAEGDADATGRFSRSSDLRHLLGLSSNYVSSPRIPLARDGLTALLVILVGCTFACAYGQCCVIAECIPGLERSGVLAWRAAPRVDLAPKLQRRSIRQSMSEGTPSRSVFADWLQRRMLRIRRTEPVMLAVAAVLAAALQFVILKSRSLASLAPSSYTPRQRAAWTVLAYRSWWASYYHWPGAIAFFLIATFGIFVILLQNAILTAVVATASVIFAFAEPGVDWLNADGHYGWLPVERVFKASYLSVGLRGLTLSALIIGFGERSSLVFLIVAVGWLMFVLAYHIVPYQTLFAHLARVRQEHIDALCREARKFRGGRGQRRRESMRFYANEIRYYREANINPMHLPKWQFSTFALAVILPVILTVVQVYF